MSRLSLSVVASSLLLSACGDAQVPAPAPALGTDRLDVRILVSDSTTAPLENPRLPDARVAIDFGAERREATTDAEGIAHFEEIALDRLTDVIAIADGYAFVSYSAGAVRWRMEHVGSDPMTMWIRRRGLPPQPELITVHGKAAGYVLESTLVVTGTDDRSSVSVSKSSSWSLEVPRGEPFTLFARDYLADGTWAGGTARDFPGMDRAGDLDLDVADGTPTRTAHGTFRLPRDPTLRNEGASFMWVQHTRFNSPLGYLGSAEMVKKSPNGESTEFTTTYIDQPERFHVETKYYAYKNDFAGQAEYYSFVFDDAPPRDGDFDPQFLAPPRAVMTGGVHPMEEPLDFEIDPDAGPTPDVVVLLAFDPTADFDKYQVLDNVIGLLAVEGNERRFTFPRLPGSLDVVAQFGGTGLGWLYSGTFADERAFDRHASGPVFLLVP